MGLFQSSVTVAVAAEAHAQHLLFILSLSPGRDHVTGASFEPEAGFTLDSSQLVAGLTLRDTCELLPEHAGVWTMGGTGGNPQ